MTNDVYVYYVYIYIYIYVDFIYSGEGVHIEVFFVHIV